MPAHDPTSGPPDPVLADELWSMICREQGYAFISDGIEVLSRPELFGIARASLKHSRVVCRRLEKWLKEHDEY